jgi:hypothetical protein
MLVIVISEKKIKIENYSLDIVFNKKIVINTKYEKFNNISLVYNNNKNSQMNKKEIIEKVFKLQFQDTIYLLINEEETNLNLYIELMELIIFNVFGFSMWWGDVSLPPIKYSI